MSYFRKKEAARNSAIGTRTNPSSQNERYNYKRNNSDYSPDEVALYQRYQILQKHFWNGYIISAILRIKLVQAAP